MIFDGHGSKPRTGTILPHALERWKPAAPWRALGPQQSAVTDGVLVLAGSLVERLCVGEAGKESARNPRSTIGPQRQRRTADGLSAS